MTESWFERAFEKLKEVIKIDIKFNNLINIQINNNNSSNQVDYSEEEKYLSVNYQKLPYIEKNKIREITKGAQREGVPVLFNETQELIKDIKSNEAEPEVKSILIFFKSKIPPDDFSALRAAIYIDKRAREGLGYKEVYRLKGEVARRFGGRGLKICNLYALGYFETMIKPIYEEFNQDSFFDRKKFIRKYNIVVNEEAFAVFVPDIMEKDEVKSAIESKIARNLKYGRRDVTIHSKGKYNIAKVREAISNIDEEGEYLISKKDIEETENSITAKLWF
jgi:nucleoside diphosphate kinase